MTAFEELPRPFWLRWSESDAHTATLKSSWANAIVCGLILLVNAGILTLLAMNPQPGKQFPGYMIVYIVLCFAALTLGLTAPFWGGQRVRFVDGLFIISSRVRNQPILSLSLGELRSFDTTETDSGYRVVALKTTGEHLPLDLSIEDLFRSVSGRGTAANELRRKQNHREARFVSSRLNVMLARAREARGSYRG